MATLKTINGYPYIDSLTSDAPTSRTVAITSGQALSAASAALTGATLVGVVTPAAWTAADMTFQASWDGGVTYADVYDEATEYTIGTGVIATAASRYFAVNSAMFYGATNVKVRSGTGAAPVNQGAGRTVTLIARGLA